MFKSFFEKIPCATPEEERELYEVAANYDDFGDLGVNVPAKNINNADLDLAQVIELNRLTHEPAGLLDICP